MRSSETNLGPRASPKGNRTCRARLQWWLRRGNRFVPRQSSAARGVLSYGRGDGSSVCGFGGGGAAQGSCMDIPVLTSLKQMEWTQIG